jgi:hypothetical protein
MCAEYQISIEAAERTHLTSNKVRMHIMQTHSSRYLDIYSILVGYSEAKQLTI